MDLTRRRALKVGAGALSITIAGCTADSPAEAPDDEDDLEQTPEQPDETDTADESAPDEPSERADEDQDEDDETDEAVAGSNPETQSLELLAEASVDHDHACFHAEYDDRTPLEAGDSVEESPTESHTHVIWDVTYDGDSGYVRFDADAHAHGGPIVFYTAGGSATPVDGTELVQDTVPDEDCSKLDEYLQVEPDDGQIVLEVTTLE
ncbi:hypothetical protein [Natrarchaeobaculum aegyptiacum]|uniref:Uncharacterized protein n=1 Tax=Natrarchaeobaculum aegyptiacum TaxID=745377 RepID=A0A2Z2HP51_9EURY|nr:hypothetical protein [Natrarchaeobaculum aegyptiacum]ARS88313.1 hypothetical protein B1756_00085 [Natrarchaeobaculum aegyptiacum]